MSWDFYLVDDNGDEITGTWFNYTYNVSGMFDAAVGETPSEWDGRKAGDLVPVCSKILADFADRPEFYRAMNPENGWGDFEGARTFIRNIQDVCADRPDAPVHVC
jgi:hypothetical protein